MENKPKVNSTVLSVYRSWLDCYENKIGKITDMNPPTLITETLVDTIRRRYLALLERTKR